MVLREYTNNHFNSFIKCIKTAWDRREDYDAVEYTLIDPFWYADNILNNPAVITLILEDQAGDVRGFMCGRVKENKITIMMLFVQYEYRRNGYGKMLKYKMMETAKEMGVEKVTTLNRYDNVASYEMNQAMGWRIVRVAEDYYRAEYYPEHKTLNQWCEVVGLLAIDPDGFDRSDPNLFVKRFSEEEFRNGALNSTQYPDPLQIEKYNKFFNINTGDNQ